MTQVTSIATAFEPRNYRRPGTGIASKRTPRLAFAFVCALLFVASAAATIAWCGSMSAMQGMPMPGGWTMSMVWMRMPGQTWPEAAASFAGMWAVMMIAMMLPSLAPALWSFRERAGRRTMLVAARYFFVWILFGLAVFPVGVEAAAIEMEHPLLARSVPFAAGLAILIAGAIQFMKWKAHHLARCRNAPEFRHGSDWQQGLRLGLHCTLSCANLTAILLVAGVTDVRAMAAVTAAITAERLAPAGEYVARAIGFTAAVVGVLWIARGAGLG